MFRWIKRFMAEDRQYFAACRADIAARNSRMLSKSCVVYAFVLCFYTLLTAVSDQPQILRTMYWVFDAIHLCLCTAILISKKQKKKSSRATQIYCFCLEASILSFFALEGVFVSRTQHSLYIPIAILLALLLFIHRAAYAYAITDLYVLSFAVMSYLYKTPEAYLNDLYISIATVISANIGFVLIAQMRHSEGTALAKFQRLSQTDQLTGLYNKAAIQTLCEQQLLDQGRTCSFVILDLDNFKRINDRYGHDVGDEVLKTVGKEIEAHFRETDYIGRFGGDEFIVLMNYCKDVDQAKERVKKLLRSIRELTFSKAELRVQCSAGIAIRHGDDTAHAIFKRADTALYQAKKDGKGGFAIAK
ncbi:MAG: GGDEF domain-containing protein [Eubacteriales bacterium]|nr:GGDEF domain-containing protein [Eubacteriales bacterium]